MLGHVDLERIIVRDRAKCAALAWTVGGVAVAAAFRWVIDRGANGVELATFFPVILLTAILLPWPFAVLSAILSLIAAVIFFMEAFPPNPTGSRIVLLLVYLLTAGLVIGICQALRHTIMQLNHERELIQEANVELQHRMGNAFQIVRAMASRASRSDDPRTFYQNLVGRLDAMAAANRLLGMTSSSKGSIEDIVEAAFAPFDRNRIKSEGASCLVSGDAGLVLMMALHELATNATKYGALSKDYGKVELNWAIDEGILKVKWKESGGPPVEPPTRRGIGSGLLSPHGPLKEANQNFEREGLICHLTLQI